MENKGGKIYCEEEYFAQVSNVALRDNNLSLKAKGLYALIKSYITIRDFTLYKNALKKQCVEKEKAFESTWKELKDNGYLIQYRFQDKKGLYYYEYKLLSSPNLELANEIHDKQNRKTKQEKYHTPEKVGMDKNNNIHTPKKDNMDEGYNGQGGVYNNTNLNNTNLNNTNSIDDDERIQNIIKLYTSNFKHNRTTEKSLREVTNTYGVDLAMKVINRMIELQNDDLDIKVPIRYLKNSLENELKPKKDKKTDTSKNYSNSKKTKELKFNNFEAREYDYDSLERKLLGWED